MNIRRNEVRASFVSGIQFGHDNIYNPSTEDGATERLIDDVQTWKRDEDGTVVFTSGVYDLLHLSHQAYLLHVKAAGAERSYREENSGEWEDLPSNEREEYVRYALSQAAKLRLVLSIDGDESVSVRKAGKGGSDRPIVGWNTRAITAAGLTYRNPENPKERLPLVDAVTIHGPQDFEPGHPHANLYSLVDTIGPDYWGVYEESEDILEAAPEHPRLARVALRTIGVGYGNDDGYVHDDKIGGKISTTAIVKRILQGAR